MILFRRLLKRLMREREIGERFMRDMEDYGRDYERTRDL
jgi:hypothetical protein